MVRQHERLVTHGDLTTPIKEKAALLPQVCGDLVRSQDTAIAQSVEIKAGQDILHLFIVLLVLGVDLQNEVIGHPEALSIGRQDLRFLSIAPDNKGELIIVHTKEDHFLVLHGDKGDQGVSRILTSTGQQEPAIIDVPDASG